MSLHDRDYNRYDGHRGRGPGRHMGTIVVVALLVILLFFFL